MMMEYTGIGLLVCLWLIGCQDGASDSVRENPAELAGSTVKGAGGRLVGVNQSAATPDGTKPRPTNSKQNRSNEVTIEVQDWKATENLIAQQKGKVVVLDLWSTSCEPCMREFVNLVELHEKYANGKVVCISGNCDYEGLDAPEELVDDVRDFLVEQRATFSNVLFNIESEQLWSMLKIASIPVVYVYGPDGTLAKRFDNEADGEEFTYKKDVIPFVEELLAATSEK